MNIHPLTNDEHVPIITIWAFGYASQATVEKICMKMAQKPSLTSAHLDLSSLFLLNPK